MIARRQLFLAALLFGAATLFFPSIMYRFTDPLESSFASEDAALSSVRQKLHNHLVDLHSQIEELHESLDESQQKVIVR